MPMVSSTFSRTASRVMPSESRALAATPSPSWIRPSRMCSVPMKLWLSWRASSCASTSTRRARSVNRSNNDRASSSAQCTVRSSVPVASLDPTSHFRDWALLRRPARRVVIVNEPLVDASACRTVREDLARLEPLLAESVVIGDGFLDEVTTHLIAAGGKRLRPLLALATATGGAREATQDDLMGGVAVELVHLASLYHDDVMDEATDPPQRRERQRPVRQPGRHRRRRLPPGPRRPRSPPASAPRSPRCWPTRSAGSARARCPRCAPPSRSARTVDDYFEAIGGKTAALMAHVVPHRRADRRAAPAARSTRSPSSATASGWSSRSATTSSTSSRTDGQLGKPAGQDLAEGIYTLPVLVALDDPAVRPELGPCSGQPLDQPERDKARSIVMASGAIGNRSTSPGSTQSWLPTGCVRTVCRTGRRLCQPGPLPGGRPANRLSCDGRCPTARRRG